ncbi:MAG: short-chain dehydrogenase [Rhodopseudomonas sp.]|nr:short-chain dehydrogenase [Rhodopseudomonas sp.]
MTNAALARRRRYAGPALFSYGFRIFFLSAAVWAAAGVILWLPVYLGLMPFSTDFSALDWHIHEMLFGYAAAAIAGFLLTAIPNWTGRLPVNGVPLAALALLWLAGRLAMLASSSLGPVVIAIIDVAFLAALAFVCAREIVAGRNWRNLRVLVVVTVLLASNMLFHVETFMTGSANYSVRLALAAVIVLITLVGGRIVPSFTNNWLSRNNPGRLPKPFSRYDAATLALSVASLGAWVILPNAAATGWAMLFVGVMQIFRLARWVGYRATADRLVLVLHVAYAFLPLGFLLIGLSIVSTLPASAGIHAWTAGAIGLMTLAVMTRASLGHTGQALRAGPATQTIYALVFVGAVLRIVAALSGDLLLLEGAGALWLGGFLLFAIAYGPILVRQRPAWAQVRC